MDITDSFTVINENGIPSKSEGDLASRYAMKIALQTLRDRCTKLQKRISHLEEENLNLKITQRSNQNYICENNLQHSNHTDKDSVLIENDLDVWTNLTLYEKETTQIDTNFLPSSKSLLVLPFSNPMSSTGLRKDMKIKEDSLEEISLRGDSCGRVEEFSQEKNEDGRLDEDVEFGNLASLDLALKDILKKMKKDQEILRQQQEGLKSALRVFKKIVKENAVCKTCLKRDEIIKGRENKIVSTESLVGRSEAESYRGIQEKYRVPIPQTDEDLHLKDRICPLCEKFFHCSTPFEAFNDHVLSHFVEEDDDEKVSSNIQVFT